MANMFSSGAQYVAPLWLEKKLSRRHLLKSAAGATAIVGFSPLGLTMPAVENSQIQLALQQPPWPTLAAVLNHLLPASNSGPSADDINATQYLYQLVHLQPTEQDEIDFIYQGVKWLNGYSSNKLSKEFIALTDNEKQQVLKGISGSQAGRNWLNMLILNIYEAMLSPPAYGGNPKGIGWQWLAHHAGFPLPKAGQRYYELPPRSRIMPSKAQQVEITNISAMQPRSLKGNNKA